MIVKPLEKSTAPQFTGILPIALMEFKDRTHEFAWADIFISCEVAVENNEYSRFIEIAGELEKDASGNITGGAVLNRLYKFFEQIGFKGGLTAAGTWEDENENAIDDIAAYLNERFQTGNPIDKEYKYVSYVYRAKPKEKGGKVWTRTLPRIYPNNDHGHKEMEGFVKWMRNNGYLKEATEEDLSSKPSEVTDSALANL